jgi:putative phosphoesterase
MKAVCQIGLISDTHGLMRPEALAALQGADLIIHAGDVGKPEILSALKGIAPTVAIRGNIDRTPPCSSLPPTEIVEAGDTLIYVLHNLNDLDLDPVAAGFHVVVSGHSHKPGQTERKGVLYINPGSAGPRRFRLPITVAQLDLRRLPLQANIIELAVSA